MLVAALFTRNTGDPAIGLALADIDMFLYRRTKTTGATWTVWAGVQPTEEVGGGMYTRRITTPDPVLYDYFAMAHYTGGVALDSNYSLQTCGGLGEFGAETVWTYVDRTLTRFGVGSQPFTYIVTDAATTLPIEGVEVWITTDVAGLNVIWSGHTDAFGVARDANDGLPYLDPGSYSFWTQRGGYGNGNPDPENVTT